MGAMLQIETDDDMTLPTTQPGVATAPRYKDQVTAS